MATITSTKLCYGIQSYLVIRKVSLMWFERLNALPAFVLGCASTLVIFFAFNAGGFGSKDPATKEDCLREIPKEINSEAQLDAYRLKCNSLPREVFVECGKRLGSAPPLVDAVLYTYKETMIFDFKIEVYSSNAIIEYGGFAINMKFEDGTERTYNVMLEKKLYKGRLHQAILMHLLMMRERK